MQERAKLIFLKAELILMCDGRTYNRAEMSDTFLAAASQRALDLSLPSAPLACRGDSLALLDAQPGDSDSVFFVWLAPYLTATEVLPLLSVARAWRDAGESSRLWNAWAPFSSRQQCVELLRERERIRCNLVRYYCLLVPIPNNSNTHTSFGAWSPVHARARRGRQGCQVRTNGAVHASHNRKRDALRPLHGGT